MTKLYEYTEQYLELEALLESGEYTQEELADTFEAIEGGASEKAENVAKMIDNLTNEAKMFKEEAELKSLKKISKVAALTSVCVIAIMVSQKWLGELPLIVILLLTLIAIANMVTILYFQTKINQLKDESYTFKDGIILLAVAIVSMVLYMLFVIR